MGFISANRCRNEKDAGLREVGWGIFLVYKIEFYEKVMETIYRTVFKL